MKLNIIIISLIFILGSCHDSNIEYYIEYVNNETNGLVSRQWNGNFYLKAQYLPAEYQVIQQLNRGLEKEAIGQVLYDLENHHYFLLTIESDLSLKRLVESNQKSWQDVVQNLQYNSKKKFKVRQGKMDYPCVLYHTVSGLSSEIKMDLILVFLNDQPSRINDDLVLVFEDDLFTDEVYELIIAKEAIQNIPEVELL